MFTTAPRDQSKRFINKSVYLKGIDTVYNASDRKEFKWQGDSTSGKDNANKINRTKCKSRRKYWGSAGVLKFNYIRWLSTQVFFSLRQHMDVRDTQLNVCEMENSSLTYTSPSFIVVCISEK